MVGIKKLNIILTNSFQNDFIEPVDGLSMQMGDNLKLDYGTCANKWIEYFKGRNTEVNKATVDNFISWLKTNAQDQNIDVPISYHRILEKYKHRVHLDYNESQRLWGDGRLAQFLRDLMTKASEAQRNENSDVEYQCIHLRDWHDQTDPTQRGELDHFGIHCVKGTYGSKFATPLNELINAHREFNLVLNSNSISSFDETGLQTILDTLIKNSGNSKRSVNIGIFGVITNVKVQLLTFELMVIHKYKNVYVCKDFCAGFNNQGHEEGLSSISNVYGAQVVDHAKFREVFKI